jgi:hypothetical protein
LVQFFGDKRWGWRWSDLNDRLDGVNFDVAKTIGGVLKKRWMEIYVLFVCNDNPTVDGKSLDSYSSCWVELKCYAEQKWETEPKISKLPIPLFPLLYCIVSTLYYRQYRDSVLYLVLITPSLIRLLTIVAHWGVRHRLGALETIQLLWVNTAYSSVTAVVRLPQQTQDWDQWPPGCVADPPSLRSFSSLSNLRSTYKPCDPGITQGVYS